MVQNTKAKATNRKDGNSFFKSTKFLTLIGNFFCAIPLQGLHGDDINEIKFMWIHWKTLVNIFITVAQIFMVIWYIYLMVCDGFRMTYLATVVFFANCFLSFIFFLLLSKDWVLILKEWDKLERRVNRYTCKYETHMRRKILFITITFLIFALIDNMSNVASQIIRTRAYRQDSEFFEYFFAVVAYPGIFKITSYALWKGIAAEILNFIGVFSWTYVDVFIMSVSIALSSKFKEMSFRIEQYVRKDVSDIYFWKIVREDYCHVCLLTKLMNTKLSYLILLSSANNLYFILSQCFQSLRNVKDSNLRLYFIYSFSFVILRTVSVYLIAASVNMESLKPLKYLYVVKSHMYNLEVKRLIRYIALDSICITGKNFFNIKRHVLLDLAGALVTYELVIVQFTKDDEV